MNRIVRIVQIAIVVSLAFAGDASASDAIASGPVKPAISFIFCYAFGSARDGGATTYYTGVFEVNMKELAVVQNGFRKFLADKYGSQPDPRSGDRDITCVGPSPSSAEAAQQQMNTYVGNMRRGGGKVVESGWQNAATATAPAPGSP